MAVCGWHSPRFGHTGFALYWGVCAFPVYTAQAPGCSIWSRPCVECSSSFRVLHNSAVSVALACCVFSGPSSSGSQRLSCVLPGVARLFPPRRAARAARGLCGLSRMWRAFSLRGERPGQPEVWRPLHGRAAPFPSAAPARAAGRVSGSLQTGTGGLFAVWEGVASLGLSLPLSPPPCLLPPAGMGRLFSAVSQSFCFANHQRCVQAG